ncbi:MAG: 8-amino-7-oxononanoate synthase [Stagnimonas sp.]|nr:8-amino-7-oxononanoate synthase [Stagnimonas sp.]
MDGTAVACSPLDAQLRQQLAQLRAQDLYRTRRTVSGTHGARIVVDGQSCVNFCSNDYLGLAGDARIAAAASKALSNGVGSGASALVSGYNREHAQLEEALADHVQRPRALLFSSGWAANLGVMRALLGKDDTLIADELNHASLIDGGRLAGARYVRVPHGDVSAFADALASPREGRTLLATDSIFSMDGDLAPLASLSSLASAHGAALMVDDAHGFGVLGGGRGVLFESNSGVGMRGTGDGGNAATPYPVPRTQTPPLEADIYMAGFGKALGTAGAFVAGSEALIEFLIQRARTFVFSTAPPPALAAATRASLALIAGDEGVARRTQLAALIARFRQGCAQQGIALLPSSTAIQPLVLGAESRALTASRALLERGYWVAAIRPPTVPVGTARLRITLTATHTATEVDGLVTALTAALKAA